MSEAQPEHRPKKGQMRCFRCRKMSQSKDGDWRDHQNQQVFLCKECGREPLEPRKGFGGSR